MSNKRRRRRQFVANKSRINFVGDDVDLSSLIPIKSTQDKIRLLFWRENHLGSLFCMSNAAASTTIKKGQRH
jgi:hypothetical protein